MTTDLGPETVLLRRQDPAEQPLSLSQWSTCFKYGWSEPTTTAARLGHDFGHSALSALIVLASSSLR